MRAKLETFVNETKGWAGLPMKSKCLTYQIPSTTCVPLSLLEKQQWGPFPYVAGQGFNYTASSAGSKTTVTFTTIPFVSTATDSFGVRRPLQDYRTLSSSPSVPSRDFYGAEPAPLP